LGNITSETEAHNFLDCHDLGNKLLGLKSIHVLNNLINIENNLILKKLDSFKNINIFIYRKDFLNNINIKEHLKNNKRIR